jgi:hypothetical protein
VKIVEVRLTGLSGGTVEGGWTERRRSASTPMAACPSPTGWAWASS